MTNAWSRGSVNRGIWVPPSAPTMPLQANIAAYWLADDIAGSNGDRIASWTDRINGQVWTGAGSTKPYLATNRIGGRQTLQFTNDDGTNYCTMDLAKAAATQLTSALDGQNYGMFVVFRRLTPPGSGYPNQGPLFYTDTATCSWNIGDGSAGNTLITDGFGSWTIPTPAVGEYMMLGGVSSTTPITTGGGVKSYYVNGLRPQARTGTWPASGTKYQLGFSGFYKANAEIAAIVCYNVTPTSEDVLKLEKYFRYYYGQSYLWTGLPYLPVMVGDSITASIGTTTAPLHTLGYLLAADMSWGMGTWANEALESSDISNMETMAATSVDKFTAITGIPTLSIGFEWANHRVVSDQLTAAQNYINNRKAVSTNKILWGDSTSDYLDGTAGTLSDRQSYNAGCTALTGTDGLIVISADAQIGQGITTTNNAYANHGTNYADGVHPNDTGTAYLKDVIKAKVLTI